MKFIEKILGGKLNLKAIGPSQKDAENYARYRIIKQFFVSSHQDSLQITSIEKSHLHRKLNSDA